MYLFKKRGLVFFFLEFFICGSFFKVFIELVTILLLFDILIFWLRDLCDLSSSTRYQTHTPALESEVLTTGPPGKFPRKVTVVNIVNTDY